MIDIHNNELFSICHFSRLALNPTRSGRLLPYVRMCVCMCIHTYVCIQANRCTHWCCNRRRIVSLFHLHTNTHAHLNVGYTCRHYTHAYICIYIRTSHVRAPQGKLIKVCYKKYTASLRYYLVSTFSIFHSIFFCLLSPRDTDKCMR